MVVCSVGRAIVGFFFTSPSAECTGMGWAILFPVSRAMCGGVAWGWKVFKRALRSVQRVGMEWDSLRDLPIVRPTAAETEAMGYASVLQHCADLPGL